MTGHFTSYETRTNHELTTQAGRVIALQNRASKLAR